MQHLIKVICLGLLIPVRAFAVESPPQKVFPYFEDDRWAQTTGLNGRTFETGFTFAGWFYFRKFHADVTGIAGAGWETFGIDSHPGGELTLWFKQIGGFSAVELDQWVNLAVSAGDGVVRFYKNGTLFYEEAAADTAVTFPEGDGAAFFLGSFWGSAKQLKVWGKVLSQDDLQAEITFARSEVNAPDHQWLMDEGTGSAMRDTGSQGAAPFLYTNKVIWKHVDSPYDILLESEIKVSAADRKLPGSAVWGSADFDQDGVREIFLHGGNDDYFPEFDIPMLVLKLDSEGRLVDASDSLIEGGLFFHNYPTGRETTIADLDQDGFDDIFAATSSGHGSILPEPSILLLSNGPGNQMVPSAHRIKAPPCTRSSPQYDGQKPCQTSNNGGLVYPDENAPLGAMSHFDYGHATSSGDIDRDGDIDLYVQTIYGAERDELPVASYFLINDGEGNFTANWQLVPYKAMKFDGERFEGGPLDGREKDLYYNFGTLSDFDQDGYLDMALINRWDETAELQPPDHPFDVETETPSRSVYELIAWGDENGFSEEYSILWPKELPSPSYRGSDTQPFAVDFDNDGDEDLIVNRVNDSGYPGSWLQVFRNNGDRVFEDVTNEYLPQNLEDINSRPRSISLEPYDLNQDGCTDFIAKQEFPARDLNGLPPFRIWVNDCKGRFSPVKDSLFGKVGLMIPLDADGDGGLDFVSINRGVDANGKFLEATLLKQVAPINISAFTDRIFNDGFE